MLNQVALMGYLTDDPEVRYTRANVPAVRYTLAVDRGGKEGTDFIYIRAWDRRAEFARDWLKKGMRVVVTGQLRQRLWEDRQGITRSIVEVCATEQYFAERKLEADVFRADGRRIQEVGAG
ncbi:MAG: single-stranded DNA-binding protein [Butyricicoccaceae bacterium]